MITKALYILVLSGTKTDSMFTIYAVDQAEAEEIAKDLEAEYNASRVSLQACPRGFRIVLTELAGTIQVPEEVI